MNVPNEVREYAYSYMENFEYADNLRFCIKGDSASEAEYLKAYNRGCCGFVDYVKFPYLIDGKEYYFGFNYGH
jgi:hypothetical protein